MFFKDRINKLEQEVQDLKKKVFLLENPYRFKVGEKVKVQFMSGGNYVDGIIVKRRLNEPYNINGHYYYVLVGEHLEFVSQRDIKPSKVIRSTKTN